MVKFLITTLQRSGSTFLESVLNSHPQIHCYGEILHGRETENKLDHFYRFWLDRVRHDGVNITYRGMVQSFELFLDDLFISLPHYKAVSVDIKYDQLLRIPTIYSILKKHNFRVIHLIRSNVLKMLISKKLNFQKKELGRRAHGTDSVPPATIFIDDIEALYNDLTRRVEDINEKRKILSHKFPYLELHYEEFFSNPYTTSNTVVPDILDKIYKFLNIDDKRYDLCTDLKKTNPNNLSDMIDNYVQVKKAFEDTPYAHFLDP